MNFEFFAFLVFMSFSSFAIAFLAYAMVVRCMGKEGAASRWSQILLVPACIIIYNFITIASGDYKYWVGSVPLVLVAGVAIYYRLIKGENFAEEQKSPAELAALRSEPKKFSKKSQRIHEARKKRGRD